MSLPGAGLLAVLRGQAQGTTLGTAHDPPRPATSAASPAAPAPEDRRFSARSDAVRAVEHAVAAGGLPDTHKKAARGRLVPPGDEYVFDMDVHAPHEAQVELEVSPITMLHSEYELAHHHQIAVNERYICYGLKQGHIRVLCRTSADRHLCKGHTVPISDMRFASGDGDLLATGSAGGRLIVWRLEHSGSQVTDTQVLNVEFSDSSRPGSLPAMRLAWVSMGATGMLAVGVGAHVVLVAVDPSLADDKMEVDLSRPSGVTVLPGWPAETVTSLAASPDGHFLAAGSESGTTAVWQLPPGAAASAGGSPTLLAGTAAAGGAVGGLQWLPAGAGADAITEGFLLVVGNANCSILDLWHCPPPAVGANSASALPPPELARLQRLKFECAGGPAEFFNHVEGVAAAGLVVVADTPKKGIYTLHYSGTGAACRFDYIARFGVGVPVLNLTACWAGVGGSPAGGEGGGSSGAEEAEGVELFCVQTTAIQMYKLDPELCRPAPGEVAAAPAEPSRPAGPFGDAAASLPQPSSQLATAFAQRTADSEDLESTASAPAHPVELPSSPAAAAASPAAAAVAAAESAAAGEPGAAGTAADAAADGAASAGAAGLEGEASIVDSVSVLHAFPQPPGAEGEEDEERAGAGSPPLDLEAMSGIPTPEEPASPPSTPVAGLQASVPVPVPMTLPIEPLEPPASPSSSAPEPMNVPQPHMADAAPGVAQLPAAPAASAASAAVGSPLDDRPQRPAPRLLTPGEVAQQLQAPAPERGSPSPSPSQPQPSLRILQRPLAPPQAPPAAPTAPSSASAAADASAAALAGAVSESLAEAVSESLGGAHKKFVGHVSLMFRELVKAMRSEMAAQARASEAAVAGLVNAALEASRRQVAEERAAVLAEERANVERLLVLISSSINQDLPARLQEMVRSELAAALSSNGGAAAGAVTAAVGPAVQQAVQASLPKEVSGAVKAQLEKSLEKQLEKALSASLAAQLAKPLQDSFRSAFQKSLLPAFEGACQSMFGQINSSLAAGFQEHVQAARAAVEEPGALAAQLRESLATAAVLAADLRKESVLLSQQLSRTASLTSGSGPAGAAAAAVDMRAQLARDLAARRYEDAFATALGLQDLSTVVWLCSQADPGSVLGSEPCPLSQMVLLSLVQQLSADLSPGAGSNLSTKLAWVREAAMLVNPADPLLAPHFRPVMDQVYAALQGCAARVHGADASACKLAMHVVHSQMSS